MANNILKFSSVKFTAIKEEIEKYLRNQYHKADQLFSSASPYGQILKVVQELYQLSMLYLKNSIAQFDMSNVNYKNKRIIQSNALIAGHVASRGVSATGLLKLSVNSSTIIENDIPGGKVTIFNKTKIKNKTNNLSYLIDLGGSDKITYNLTNNSSIIINVIQGEYESKLFTGTGEINQSYQVNISGRKDVENFNTEVKVNGDTWSVRKHLYDILPGEKACVVRTGFSGGIEVIFGNNSFGDIPPLSSVIEVVYILTDGEFGNIFRRTANDWNFVDDVLDGTGLSFDITQFLDVNILADINFGTAGESVEFTRNILPLTSQNFVIATPQQYAYQIKRLGVFSHVSAYELNGTVNIVATPNVNLFKNANSNYFTIDDQAFFLDAYEISKIDKYLKAGGNIQLTKKYVIKSPDLSHYVMNVFLVIFDDVTLSDVSNEIEELTSEYFLDFNRTARIPKKDLINKLSTIKGIDSIDIQFLSKKNENYHESYAIDETNKSRQTNETFISGTYDSTLTMGLDPVLGDILFEPNEIPVCRGGWSDRNGIFYSQELGKDFSSINIIQKGTTNRIDTK
jgi:hypothetical protein